MYWFPEIDLRVIVLRTEIHRCALNDGSLWVLHFG